jgi:hypothetical protein
MGIAKAEINVAVRPAGGMDFHAGHGKLAYDLCKAPWDGPILAS